MAKLEDLIIEKSDVVLTEQFVRDHFNIYSGSLSDITEELQTNWKKHKLSSTATKRVTNFLDTISKTGGSDFLVYTDTGYLRNTNIVMVCTKLLEDKYRVGVCIYDRVTSVTASVVVIGKQCFYSFKKILGGIAAATAVAFPVVVTAIPAFATMNSPIGVAALGFAGGGITVGVLNNMENGSQTQEIINTIVKKLLEMQKSGSK
jgi:hypothetical protein